MGKIAASGTQTDGASPITKLWLISLKQQKCRGDLAVIQRLAWQRLLFDFSRYR